MGGAGFIYPKKNRSSRGYGIGDRICCILDFPSNVVIFKVNGEEVSIETISNDSQCAFPTISCEGGDVDAVVTL